MSKYIVRTIEIEPQVELQEKEFFDKIPFSENVDNKFGNRFPFEDTVRSKLEVYEYGTLEECNDFIKSKIPSEIQGYFTVEEYIS